jgi:catechol 2,3-dioxygenase-like lactoylglutathione lyase family enzyme
MDTASVRLGNINLFVRDIARSRRFYAEGLGLEEDPERSAPPAFVLLRDAAGCTLALQDASAPEAAFGAEEGVELGFAVEDVEAALARLVAAGGEASEVQQMGWGTGADVRDPDGHRLTLYRLRDPS